MPGILYHLSFAELIYQRLSTRFPELDKATFIAGNLIPDLAIDKFRSHYRVSASVEGLFRPDTEAASADLLSELDAVKLGIFCHLYLDARFIESFLIPEFKWNREDGTVIRVADGSVRSIAEFFSDRGLYGAYTEINGLLLRDGHIDTEILDLIPDKLPECGIRVFDTRREKTWRTELNEYISENRPYSGNLLDYGKLWSKLLLFADSLAALLNSIF
ncbi:MAG: hypothetical protein IKB34_07005 [Clostridia bacterium]|nr:hypothetical protein [Clostridia bacterium]